MDYNANAGDKQSFVHGSKDTFPRTLHEHFEIRRMCGTDRDAVCKVCLRTGDAGKDASMQFKDKMLLGKRWVLPYFEFGPDLSFVLVDKRTSCVIGYALGCLDTLMFESWLSKVYLPRMRLEYPISSVNKDAGNRDHEVINDFHVFAPAPAHISTEYVGHIHIDIFPEYQGMGLGKPFLTSVFKSLRDKKCGGIHLEMAPNNLRALRFYNRLGLRKLELSHNDTVLYLGMKFKTPNSKTGNKSEISKIYDKNLLLGNFVSMLPSLWDWKEASCRQGEEYDETYATLLLDEYESVLSSSNVHTLSENIEAVLKKRGTQRVCLDRSTHHLASYLADQTTSSDEYSDLLVLCSAIIVLLQSTLSLRNIGSLSDIELQNLLQVCLPIKKLSRFLSKIQWQCSVSLEEERVVSALEETALDATSSSGYFNFTFPDKRLYRMVLRTLKSYYFPFGLKNVRATAIPHSVPVTELRNEFCLQLDGSLSAVEFMRILKNTDAQVFTGKFKTNFPFCLLFSFAKPLNNLLCFVSKTKRLG